MQRGAGLGIGSGDRRGAQRKHGGILAIDRLISGGQRGREYSGAFRLEGEGEVRVELDAEYIDIAFIVEDQRRCIGGQLADVVGGSGERVGERQIDGAHLDAFETYDDRKLIPGTLFTVEPGIYMPEKRIGIRSEVDVYHTGQGAEVTGPPHQEELVRIEI